MKEKKTKKHFFFDMDGTVTASRQRITDEMSNHLDVLKKTGKDIIIISGQAREQMLKQLGACDVSYVLAQSGNDTPFWKDQKLMTEDDKREVCEYIKQVEDFCKDKNILGKKDDLLQDRGSQMAFSFLGHNFDVEKKKAFDPKGDFRREVLKKFPFDSVALECRIAGTTCLDFTYKDSVKGKNIEKLIKHMNWEKDNCIYFGDALFEGGNDQTVLGVIDSVEVADPKDLIFKLKEILETNEK